MTILEERFMEQVPRLLRDIANEIAKLREEIVNLEEQVKTRNTE